MIKKFTLLASLVCMGVLSANPFAGERLNRFITVANRVDMANSSIIIGADGSFWELFPVEVRDPTWREWVSGSDVPALEEAFLVELETWGAGMELELYRVENGSITDEVKKEYSQPELDQAEYLLSYQGTFVFARKIVDEMPSPFQFLKETKSGPHKVTLNLELLDSQLFILDGERFIEVFPAIKREQTWWEWCRGICPEQPEEAFIVDLSSWEEGSYLNVYPVNWDKVDDIDWRTYQCEEIYEADVIVSPEGEFKFAFGRNLTFEQLMLVLKVYGDRKYDHGYDKGYEVGQEDGYREGTDDGRLYRDHLSR